ncbi:methyl-accepting chemotaxis protein [Chitiniphilus eburneus]|uniref:Methyl-accepting chemotaxis protein n=1 Tax=Chitiniphilus eburneus TaxID=2571148 RepID=A0A4U0QAW0_9NEIS|nr:methyl-accepting chemotaxis protein [Chitiniphilus eburneus]TJZ72964.1 methyl-accepting chemotaxis protein [Chitiniphilus eburneus]
MPPIKDWSIRVKIMSTAAVAIIVGFAIMIAILAVSMLRGDVAAGHDRVRQLTEDHARQVQDYFAQELMLPYNLSYTLLGLRGVQQPGRAAINDMLASLLGANPNAIGVWMVWERNAFDGKDDEFRLDPSHDPSGLYAPYLTRTGNQVTLDSLLSAEQRKVAETYRSHPQDYVPPYTQAGFGDFYFLTKQRQQETVIDPYLYEIQGKQVLVTTLSVPVMEQGRVVAVVGSDVPLDTLQRLLAESKPEDAAFMEILTDQGMVVAGPDATRFGNKIDEANYAPGFMQALATGKGMEFKRNDMLYMYQPITIPRTGKTWMLGMAMPESVILEGAIAARNQAILVGVVATLAILAVMAAALTAVTRPLGRLADAMEEVSAGEGDLTRRLEVLGKDEIGRTSTAFNRFLGALQDMFREVRQRADEIAASSGTLRDGAARVQDGTQQQAEAATATAASVEQVTVSVQHIANSASDFRENALQAGRSTEAGQQVVLGVAQEIAVVNESMQQLDATMVSLQQRSQQVDHIVQVIRGIADQTNLLALNAAIEAARAGELGRGFAVVADEVRKLAEHTGSATVEIDGIMKEIQREVGSANEGVGHAHDRIEQSVTRSREASAALEEIRDQAKNMVAGVSTIAEATQQQAAASTDIARNIEQISNKAQENQGLMGQTSSAIADLDQQAEQLRTLVARFKI